MIRHFQRQSKRITKTERAYAAGFFDGEGWISISRSLDNWPGHVTPRYSFTIGVAQNNVEPLLWLQQIWGGRLYTAEGRIPTLQLSKTEGVRFLRHVLPYLKVKREKALLALEFAAIIKPSGNKPPTTEERLLREDYRARLSERRYSEAALTTE